ncbi:hypothetical protein GCM10011490_16660 [Pseudoclavibacter endophyticus]|uniref:diacylglycerol/lipid kinase family protein n=1 Tax=Pseudoclavibacter endophyticus TaxID=1778590 RepID=UPI00166EAFEB|nr:diacylglycerol kinase family protein [Pseudoclavibacter endophyticus]GGA66667.1 hypothetical protein GCM10011490_16660 [Pseudoclavibacter endophyticus]
MPNDPQPTGNAPRAAIIAHPGKVDMDALHSAVRAAERRYGWHESAWYETTPERLGDALAREALGFHPAGGDGPHDDDDTDGEPPRAENAAAESEAAVDDVTHPPKPDLVIAAGGDGTVRAVAATLQNTGIPLGIVPAGTGNLLARNLGIDVNNVAAAVETAFAGNDARIDTGLATAERPDGTREDFVFTVLGGVGIDAGMIANTPSGLKRKVGWLAYLTGIVRSIRAGAHFTARVRVGVDHSHPVRAQSIMVGNCGLMPGGMMLLPDASTDDGLLDMCVLRPRGLLGWVKVWARISWQTLVARSHQQSGRTVFGRSRDIRALRYEQGAEVVFRLTSGPQEFEIDGEAVGEIVAARLQVQPLALTVRTPTGKASRQRLLLDEVVARSDLQRRRMRRRMARARSRLSTAARATNEAVTEGADAVGTAVAEGASTVGTAVAEGASTVGTAVAEGASTVGTAVAEGASTVSTAAGDAAEAARDAITEPAESAGLAAVGDPRKEPAQK